MPDISPKSDLPSQLDELTPGRLPETVFETIAKLVVTPTYVVVPVFRRGDRTRIVLTRRTASDTHYAGMLHPPGKILLATDTDLESVFARLIATEMPDINIRSAPIFVAHFFDQITRSREVSLVHYLEVDDPGDGLSTYDHLVLPKDIIQTDIQRIIAAVETFVSGVWGPR